MKITDNYVFFWSGFFSQWHPSKFSEYGYSFTNAEQFMMASKAMVFNDQDRFEDIMVARTPKQQKAIGRQIQGFDKELWDNVCIPIVTIGNVLKFSQDAELNSGLAKYADKTFVEASPYDRIWGIGKREDDDGIEDPSTWRGLNYLGVCITNTADILINNNTDLHEQYLAIVNEIWKK